MKNNPIQTSLQRKFAGRVLFNSLLATLLLVVVFALWRYQFTLNAHQQRIDSLSSQHLTGLENSLWLMDNLQTRRQLNELKLILNIDYAEITLESKEIAAVGILVKSPLLSKSIKIKRTEGGKTFDLGTLNLHLDQRSIIAELLNELLPLLAIVLLAVITPAILNNYNMKKLITGRLVDIVDILNQSGDSDKLKEQLTAINSKGDFDEIDRLSEEIADFHRINTALTQNLQQQQHHLNAIFNNTDSLLSLVDANGNIVNINQSAIDLSQLEKQQLLETPFWEFLWQHWSLDNKQQIKTLTESALNGSLVREEIAITSDNQQLILDFSFIPIINNSEVEYVLIEALDVTQIRLWETQQDTQVKLLKYFLAENNLSEVMDKMAKLINELLPSGAMIHIFQENSRKTGHDIVAGGFKNSTQNLNFQEVISSLLKTEFSINNATTVSLDNKALRLSPEISGLLELLPFKQLYIEPVAMENNTVLQHKIFSIITLDTNQEISSFIRQLCSMCSSLAEMAIHREQQVNLTLEVEQTLGKVVNSSLDGILVVNEHAQITQANDAFASLIGDKNLKFDGKNLWDLPISITEYEILALINSTKISGKQRYQVTINHENDSRYCDLTLVTIGEKFQQFYVFFQDRTEQQLLINELEEQYLFIRTVLDNTSDAILACDKNGVVTLYNNKVNKLLKTPASKIGNDEWRELYTLYEDDGVTQIPLKKYPLNIALTTGQITDASILAKSQDGTIRHLICNGARLYSNSGEIIGAVVTATDITAEHKARVELEQHQKHLEHLVAVRTEDLQQANKELEAFSYSVSHDLRAPLRSINGFAEILQEDYAGLISNSGQDLLDRIMKNATHLGSIIEGLLSLSKISRKEVNFDSVDLSKICNDLIEDKKQTFPQLECQITEGLLTSGDAALIKIMLQNLISNAVKYSNNSNPQRVNIFTENIEGKKWFVIEDNGVGFNNKFSDKIFKPFQRAHGDEYEGNGIGLSIVQRIIERHQGEIKISSKLNKGTRIEFHLPERIQITP